MTSNKTFSIMNGQNENGVSNHPANINLDELVAERDRRRQETKREFEILKKYIMNFNSRSI